MGEDKKPEDVWDFTERTETKGRASIKDERGSITVGYDTEAQSAEIIVRRQYGGNELGLQLKFEGGEETIRRYMNLTQGFPAMESYIKDNLGQMAGAFAEDLELLGLEELINYSSIRKL